MWIHCPFACPWRLGAKGIPGATEHCVVETVLYNTVLFYLIRCVNWELWAATGTGVLVD